MNMNTALKRSSNRKLNIYVPSKMKRVFGVKVAKLSGRFAALTTLLRHDPVSESHTRLQIYINNVFFVVNVN